MNLIASHNQIDQHSTRSVSLSDGYGGDTANENIKYKQLKISISFNIIYPLDSLNFIS